MQEERLDRAPIESTGSIESNDSPTSSPFDENAPIPNFPFLPEETLKILRTELAPDMKSDDLRFCQTHYRKEKRLPSCGELRLLNRLIAVRRSDAESYVISELHATDRAIVQTYEDLITKHRYLLPDRKLPPTLTEAASVAGNYMRMIGRGDDIEVEPKTVRPPVPATAFVLLTPRTPAEEVAYEQNLSAFLADREIAPLYSDPCRVNRFGILGTLATVCRGVFADLSLLPREESDPPRELDSVEAHRGRMLLRTTKTNTAWLCEFADRFGLRATYFAKATETGRFRTPTAMDINLSFVRALMGGKDGGVCTSPEENFRSACLPDTVSASDGPLQVSRGVTVKDSCFSTSLNLTLDNVIHLVARGADRKAIGFTFRYTLPRYEVTPDALGRNLALILGAYRVAMELAAPEKNSAVVYVEEKTRQFTCTAYTPRTLRPLSDRFLRKDSKIGYLSFRRTADGLPDFESFRQMCDRFRALCDEGCVLSARAVTGNPLAVIRDMAQGGEVCLSTCAEEYSACFCQGILIEAPQLDGLPEFGRVLTPASDPEKVVSEEFNRIF